MNGNPAQLVDALRRQAEAEYARSGDRRLADLAAKLGRLSTPTAVGSERHGLVDQWLDAACDLAGETTAELAEVVRRCAPTLPWRSAYGEVTGNSHIDQMRADYAFGTVCSPAAASSNRTGPFVSDELSLFLTLQAPGVFYPEHHHRAVEVYQVIGGTAEWLRHDRIWRPRPPGTVLIHGSHEVHGMHTGDEPLLTWACWISDATSPSLLESEHPIPAS